MYVRKRFERGSRCLRQQRELLRGSRRRRRRVVHRRAVEHLELRIVRCVVPCERDVLGWGVSLRRWRDVPVDVRRQQLLGAQRRLTGRQAVNAADAGR